MQQLNQSITDQSPHSDSSNPIAQKSESPEIGDCYLRHNLKTNPVKDVTLCASHLLVFFKNCLNNLTTASGFSRWAACPQRGTSTVSWYTTPLILSQISLLIFLNFVSFSPMINKSGISQCFRSSQSDLSQNDKILHQEKHARDERNAMAIIVHSS